MTAGERSRRLRQGARALWRWWYGEMAGLLPAWLWPAAGELVVTADGARGVPPGTRVVLRLPDGRLLRRRLVLPRAAEAHLRAVVGHELERLTPLRADQALFAAEAVGPGPEPGQVEVAVVALARSAAEPDLERLRALGLVPVAIECGGVRLALQEGTGAPARHWRWAAGAAAALLLAGLVPQAAAWTRGAALERERAALRTEVAGLRTVLDADDALRDTLDRVAEQKAVQPSALVLLEVLSRLLPLDSHLTDLRYDGTTLELAGRSRDASALLPLIEDSPHFDQAAFRSALTREGDGERFEVGARVIRHDLR